MYSPRPVLFDFYSDLRVFSKHSFLAANICEDFLFCNSGYHTDFENVNDFCDGISFTSKPIFQNLLLIICSLSLFLFMPYDFVFNSFGAKFQTTFAVCFFIFHFFIVCFWVFL